MSSSGRREVCFLCQGSLTDGDVVTVRERGVKTLLKSSIERKNNEHRRFLRNLSEVTLHSACQKHYNNPKLISSYLKGAAASTSTSTRRSNVKAFDLKKHCFYCGEEADDSWEEKFRRLPYSKRNLIHKVMKIELRDRVIEVAQRRGDNWAREVLQRITGQDLCAKDAWYHRFCQRDFYRPIRGGGEKGRPPSKDVDEAMEMIFSYIENSSEECQFSLQELMNEVTTENIPQARTVKARLLEKYDEDIVIVESKKKTPVVCFKNTGYKILSDSFYQSRLSDQREERLRIVRAAADILREDIRSQVYETSQYPPPDDFLNDVESVIPESLLHFFESLILQNKRGALEKWKKKCVALSHAVISAVRPRSFVSSLLIGLSTFIYKRFGSKLLVDALSAVGFVASYTEATQLEISSIVRPEQPKVTTDGFLQFIYDNADFNINTIDGLNTFHSMGGIMVVTPYSAIESERNIDRQVRMSSCDVVTSVSVPQLITFHRTDNGGLNTIIIKDLNLNDSVSSEVTLSGCEILWLYGKWTKRADVPEWGGYMEEATNHRQSATSKILCLPFLNYPPTLYDTIYTSLLTASKKCRELGQQSCFVTFDQPLYVKAKDIVSCGDSDLQNVIVRLGGFHLLMSFMGCTGVIMAGSGLKDLLSTIYAENSLDKILSGHAYARGVRAHMLVHKVLSFYIFQEIDFTVGEKEVMEELLLFENRPSVLTCEENEIYKRVMIKFDKALHTIASRGPTAKLWTQYFYMVTIMKQFIEAERMGNWHQHLDTIKKMLPYFHAAGHFHYAKSAHLYLQEMLTLEEQMNPTEFEKFTTEGFFTIRRSHKFWCGVWSDMTIEQTLMKTMKVKGGLTHGRGFSDSVLTKWTSGMATLQDICQKIEEFCDVSAGTSEQHVDLRLSRRDRNAADSEKLIDWLLQHPPFPTCDVLMSVSSGVIGGPEVNCHMSVEVGSMGITNIVGQDFKNVSFKRKDKVVTLASCTALKIGNKKIATINPLTLFHRLCVVRQSDEDLRYCFSFELAPYPMSMFTEGGLRKGTKSSLYEAFTPLQNVPTVNSFVLDGGYLLHKVVWTRNEKFGSICKKYETYLRKHYQAEITVIFDGYPSDASHGGTKSSERSRRLKTSGSSLDIIFNEDTPAAVSQEKFLANESNKTRLISMLMKRFKEGGISVGQAEEDGDLLIVQTAISQAAQYESVGIVSEDIDVLVLLTGLGKEYKNLYFHKPGKGKKSGLWYSNSSFCFDPTHVLFIHAFTGCDVTSSFFGQGKGKLPTLLEQHPTLKEQAAAFLKRSVSQDEIALAGEQLIMALYGKMDSGTLDELRYELFVKSASKKSFNLARLPPTSDAARWHSLRVYQQVQAWLGCPTSPCQWGWRKLPSGLVPIEMAKDAAPKVLLRMVLCSCKSGCTAACGCRKSGLHCSSACKHCSGLSCENATEMELEDEEDEEFPESEGIADAAEMDQEVRMPDLDHTEPQPKRICL